MDCDPTPIACEEGFARGVLILQETCPNDRKHTSPEKSDHDPGGMGGLPVDSNTLTETEDFDQPKGVRFVLLYLCVLLGSFFAGYVCQITSSSIFLRVLELMFRSRTQAV